MQTVSEVMTRNVQFITPQQSLQQAAQMMDELNVGALPVCDGERLVGMITDRDITVRATASGRQPSEAHVDEIMSTDIRWRFEDQPIDEVMIQMADSQIRRVPVVSHDDQHKLLGIVALGDVATKTDKGQKQDVEQVMEMVSSPSAPNTKQASGNADPGLMAETDSSKNLPGEEKIVEDGMIDASQASGMEDADTAQQVGSQADARNAQANQQMPPV